MVSPITMDVGKITANIDAVGQVLEDFKGRTVEATRQVVYEYMTDSIAEAQSRAAVRSGALRRSATVLDPVVTDLYVSCVGGFNIAYGRQRDQGGEIRAKKAKMLAIPLDPIMTGSGVARYSSPKEEQDLFLLKLWGRAFLAKKRGKTDKTIELHWLLTPSVEQQGDQFFSGMVQNRMATAPGEIAGRIAQKLGGRSGP